MMLRVLFFALLAGLGIARASDKIDAPADGASALVTQPHVTAELIPESTSVVAGKPFDVALHLHMDADWHTYWVNPGDAGLATTIKWTLPVGFSAGPIQWPTPEKHAMGPLVTYGYGGDVYLLTTITPPKSDLPQHLDLKAKADWLVCQEECIPGKAELTVSLDSGFMNLRLPTDNTELFAAARARLPVEASDWRVTAGYSPKDLVLSFDLKERARLALPKALRFFPEQANVLGTQDADNPPAEDAGKPSGDGKTDKIRLRVALQQNGEKPEKLSGVLVSDEPLEGDAKALHFSEFPVASGVAAAVPGGEAAPPVGTAGPPADGIAAPTAEPPPLLIAVLSAAFVGGLILNLMPCVLPVLSLKVFSLIKHAGNDPKGAWIQGVAFTAGVVLSFWILAGVLLTLQATGSHLGWGFQMQSPGFVLALIVLFFLIGLNLFGVFEIGSSLVGLDAKATSGVGGSASSFLNGALATLAATPCTAPFMGSALGFAAQQSAFISLLVFTFLALGMAAPYLLLSIFPAALRFVPKPGAWMESFKQLMGFLLMGTVIFLVYVFGALVGQDQVPGLLGVLLLVSLAAWIYGRWTGQARSVGLRFFAGALSLLILLGAVGYGITIAKELEGGGDPQAAATTETKGWQPWTPDAVDAALAQGKPVFVDFTAAWCLSCKVNERVALESSDVKEAFAQKNVALLRGDWTHSDPKISDTLQHYHRDGVPLYLLYSPKAKDDPQVLPEVLTPGLVLDALNKI